MTEPVVRTRRRWVTVVLAVVAVPFALLTASRLLGIDVDREVLAALALTPYAAVGVLVLAVVTLVLRRWWTGAVAGLLAVTLTVLVAPRLFAADQPQVSGQRLRILAANLYTGQADPTALVNLVRDNKVDVVSLVELTSREVAALGTAGMFALLPYRVLHPGPGNTGSGLASKYPLTELALSGASTAKEPSAQLTIGTANVEIVAAHPVAPTWSVPMWRSQFADLPKADSATLRIVAGDFNATLDTPELRKLLDSGYVDAADQRGDGLLPTWPDGLFPPPVTLDHVLADHRIAVTGFRVFDVPGSDHDAVYAELTLP
ncbi:MAG: endonuclease [Amycolatopsis sp.]|jgi:endonuclease/exonuclease/phosphatase (EEP) superfamily protein YafD|uniref:endonuclease/exonuclease/phosphatase family protein n=1 Tax=Amycolatopsis sp. TaxID=37632 RepID=UPI0026302054|nr:endonuclease/exonuclease/phosphatase family protein [Amycolatopsis sp.]MCU1683890.1 endonuclease [Amycolatopsis sp.]